MQITFVTDEWERKEYREVMDAFLRMKDGKLPKDEYDKLPKKEWIDVREKRGAKDRPFLVVDNREGECWVEEFGTLDGAVLYATCVYLTADRMSDWDFEGAVSVMAPLTNRIPQ